MTTVNAYLTFNGNCEAAFDFYKKAFGGDFVSINRFGEMPPQDGMPEMSAEDKNKIMHVSLRISEETALMGSDTGGEWSHGFTTGNNFSLSILYKKSYNFFKIVAFVFYDYCYKKYPNCKNFRIYRYSLVWLF